MIAAFTIFEYLKMNKTLNVKNFCYLNWHTGKSYVLVWSEMIEHNSFHFHHFHEKKCCSWHWQITFLWATINFPERFYFKPYTQHSHSYTLHKHKCILKGVLSWYLWYKWHNTSNIIQRFFGIAGLKNYDYKEKDPRKEMICNKVLSKICLVLDEHLKNLDRKMTYFR